MSPIAEQLMEAAYQGLRQGPDVLVQWLNTNQARLNDDLAREVRDQFKQASHAGNAGPAKVAAFAGAFLFLRLGKLRESLSSFLDSYQVDFMVAQTADAYGQVREGCRTMLPRAKQIGASDLLFQLATLAGDAAFFAATTESGPDAKEKWLALAIDDVVAAAHEGDHRGTGAWYDRYVSLVSALTGEAMSTFWRDQKLQEEKLQELARVAEQRIPPDYQVPGDDAKSIQVAQTLADLSGRFGDAVVADERLRLTSERVRGARP